jgi:hypothetical protein
MGHKIGHSQRINLTRSIVEIALKCLIYKQISFGSPGRIRTSDPTVNSRLLYRLSYRGAREKTEPYLVFALNAGIKNVRPDC